ncbi:hypothetical protein [Cytobacillus firmus]|uniref:hypothetical protein n=1 Tax=Cytobacillus firmus TaxID=1399 RepID=UPI0021BD41C3|nr:hypothetical protein [Cytobacillus firmus]
MARTAADINESLQPVHLKSIKWGLIGLVFVFLCLLASIGLGAIWISPSVVWTLLSLFKPAKLNTS